MEVTSQEFIHSRNLKYATLAVLRLGCSTGHQGLMMGAVALEKRAKYATN
jgi:hypothetical protein